ncbi:MAG: TonB-dependent receptor [Azoarcus sp.]|nr:TonB-dependent receptor [Azoarcus sp.]
MPARLLVRRVAECLLAGFAATVMASPDGGEEPYFESLPVVLTVARLPQPMQDTPGAVSVIDADLIAATGYRDLARLFRLVPGMQVAQERGNDQWVTYHGLGADYPNQMQILIDGRSVYSPYFFGGADWGALPLSTGDIDRIEVVRGSDSAAYGSNAFLGVINILTRHTAAEAGSSASVSLGNHGIADASARVVASRGPLGLRISARHQQDDGTSGLKDGRRINTLNVRGDLRLSDIDELGIIAGLSQGSRGQGFNGVLFDGSQPRDATHDDNHLHLRWRHSPTADEEWSLSWYHNRERARDAWQVDSHANLQGTLGGNPTLVAALLAAPRLRFDVNNNRDSRRHNIELQHRLRRSDTLQLLWGTEWRHDWLDADSLFHDGKSRSQHEWRLFGNAEWRMAEHWLWNAGAMVENIQRDRTRLAPRLFLNWQPQAAATFRIGYSGGWRQPSLFERTADVRIEDPTYGVLQIRHQGNPALKPQHIDAYELGFLGLLPGGRGNLDVRLFHERIKDYIVRRPASFSPVNTLDIIPPADGAALPTDIFQRILGGTRWDNARGTVRLTGLEYQLRLRLRPGSQILLNHAMIRASADDPLVSSSVAPYVASLTWLQDVGAWQSTLSVLRMGPSDAGNGFAGGQGFVVDAYTTLDWSLARRLRFGDQPVEFRLSGINLLGKHQELVHRPVEFLPEYRGDKAANPLEPQIHFSVSAQF